MTGGIKGHYSKPVTPILMRVIYQFGVYLSSHPHYVQQIYGSFRETHTKPTNLFSYPIYTLLKVNIFNFGHIECFKQKPGLSGLRLFMFLISCQFQTIKKKYNTIYYQLVCQNKPAASPRIY